LWPVGFLKPASTPTKELPTPDVLLLPAPYPKKELPIPVVLDKPALDPKKALKLPVVLLSPAPMSANMFEFGAALPLTVNTRFPPMLYCVVVLIAPVAVIAAPEPVFVTERVDSGPALVNESGVLIFGEVTAPSANPAEVTAFVAIFSPVTALSARCAVLTPPFAMPSGDAATPSPVSVASCATFCCPLAILSN